MPPVKGKAPKEAGQSARAEAEKLAGTGSWELIAVGEPEKLQDMEWIGAGLAATGSLR